MSKKNICWVVSCLLGMVLLAVSCENSDDENGGQPPGEFDRAGMLENYADNLIIPAYNLLQSAVDGLKTASDGFTGDPSVANLESLQASLKLVRQSWQQANFYQFGPAEINTLRAVMNTYPTDTDKINNNIENGGYTLGSLDNIAAGGLPAIDYLLHGLGNSNAEIVTAFSSDAQAAGRIAYLMDNADFIKAAVDNVVDGWDPAGDDYRGTFLNPSNGGTGSGSAISLLVNAMILHYERFLRDGKIGIPAGVRSAGIPRPTATEAYYGGYSAELAVANLQAFKDLFTGNGGSGLDDHLNFLDSDALATDISTGLDQAIADAQALTDPLSENIENDNESVIAVFTRLQEILVLMKVDMTSVLGITITFQDNDGD